MNCSEFQHRLQQRLDGESPSSSGEFDRHLAGCTSCRELEAYACRLTEILGAQAAPAASDRLRNQIISLVLAQIDSQRLARRRWSRRVLAASAVAAGILLAAIMGYSWWGPRQAPGVSSSSSLVKKDEKPALPQPSLNIQEAGTALVALVNRTADETVGQSRILLPQGIPTPNFPATEAWQADLEPSSQAFRDAQDGVAVSFEPVTSSARRAVNLFLREVPSMESQKQ